MATPKHLAVNRANGPALHHVYAPASGRMIRYFCPEARRGFNATDPPDRGNAVSNMRLGFNADIFSTLFFKECKI